MPECVRFVVPLPAPFDLFGSLEPFRRWGDDLLDRWDGQKLLRVARLDGRPVPYLAEPLGTVAQPALRVTLDAAASRAALEREVRRVFAGTTPAFEALLETDPLLAALEARYPGVRPVLQHDPFGALVRAISAQQVN